jgi:hypothetical protein
MWNEAVVTRFMVQTRNLLGGNEDTDGLVDLPAKIRAWEGVLTTYELR